LKQSKHICQ